MGFVLEAQLYDCLPDESPRGFLPVGLMNKIFKTKNDAATFYDLHNPHMRSLNAHGTWRSDWDPINCLRFAVRDWHREELTIPEFGTQEFKSLYLRFIR